VCHASGGDDRRILPRPDVQVKSRLMASLGGIWHRRLYVTFDSRPVAADYGAMASM
jgi:hypothetical protein